MRYIFFLFFVLMVGMLASCSGCSSEDEELITQPVTNNPLIVPGYGSGLPGLRANDQPH